LQVTRFEAKATPLECDQLNESVNAARLANNPRVLTPNAISEFYQSLFDTKAPSFS